MMLVGPIEADHRRQADSEVSGMIAPQRETARGPRVASVVESLIGDQSLDRSASEDSFHRSAPLGSAGSVDSYHAKGHSQS